jgi:hypothetical protein
VKRKGEDKRGILDTRRCKRVHQDKTYRAQSRSSALLTCSTLTIVQRRREGIEKEAEGSRVRKKERREKE